jgi:large subunit ribosomal protein L13
MQTRAAKPAQAQATRKWWVIDAKDQPLGRLASRVAALLRGKHRVTFTPHVDTGDFVIVVNATKVKLTGAKRAKKNYYSHSRYPGSLKTESFERMIVRRPEVPIQKAVKGMLPKNVLGRQLIGKLKVYPGPDHPHQAQKPATLSL